MMELEALLEGLVRELELGGQADAEELLSRWFEIGQAVAGPAPAPPEPVQEVEAAGPEADALYTRAAQLQTLWVVLAGAKAELDEAQVRQDQAGQTTLLKAVSILMAFSEEESEAIRTAMQARSN
ncbi:MAG TPA: hypothetical protein VFW57_14410 [Acidimicrobiia bacterium]|nr:hypothetical protein [Acidimicrobiia bacterium]